MANAKLSRREAGRLQQRVRPECSCDLRTRLVGDGCEICNPEYAADHAEITDDTAGLRGEFINELGEIL